MLGIGLGLAIGLHNQSKIILPTILAQDSFSDPNDTLLVNHTPDIGPIWQESTGGTLSATIQNNQLSRSDPTIRHFFMDVQSPNVKLSVNVTHIENLIGLLIRRSDNSHYWEVFFDFGNQAWQMSLVNGGPDTFKGPLLAGTTGIVSLEAKDNTIKSTGPSGESHTEVDATLNTNTQIGIILDGFNDIASTLDDLLVVET